MATYKELLQQRETLDQQIRKARATETQIAIKQVQGICDEYGLSPDDVFAQARKVRGTAGAKVSPKYRHPTTGQTWTGRGKAPRWIAAVQDRNTYAIPTEQ